MSDFVKKPCKTCPFRRDVKPFLRLERVEEIAYSAANPYSDFICHSTISYDGGEDEFENATGDFSKALTCAGFLTLRAQEDKNIPEGFEPAWELCYESANEMVEAYEEHSTTEK